MMVVVDAVKLVWAPSILVEIEAKNQELRSINLILAFLLS